MDQAERLLWMMEHPDRYTDQQWEELLSDEECRQLYEAVCLSASAFEAEDAKEKIANGIKEKEWQRFAENEELRVKSEEFATANSSAQPHSSFFILHSSFQKIAAAFIGLLMLSGIAYAAIHIAHQRTEAQAPVAPAAADSSFFILHSSFPQLPSDTIPPTRVFENTPLDEMVGEIAIYYRMVTEIRWQQAHDLRLYYRWDAQATLESVVDDLNHFDHVTLSIEGDKLIVKP